MTTPTLCPTCQTPDWRVQYTATSLQGMLCTFYRCVAGHEWWHTVDPATGAVSSAISSANPSIFAAWALALTYARSAAVR